MKRRNFLAGAATAALGRTSLAQPVVSAKARTLIHVPQANLTSLDPVWTTALVTRNYAAMVFETLYGRDEQLDPQPQMVEGHQVENNGLRWTLRLRDGLAFHDGEKVLARDCVASLQRWMKRDAIGQTIAARLDELEAPDDRTVVFRLHKPFASLPYALAKTQPTPVIMPERLAQTDPFKQVPEVIGSGPFRWVATNRAGNLAVREERRYARARRSRASPPAAIACLDRVSGASFRTLPLRPTLARPERGGPPLDCDRRDRRRRHIRRAAAELPASPTADEGVRRAILAAIDQVEVMTAVMGEEKSLYRAPVGYFLPGTPSANDAGMDAVRKRPDADAIKAMLKQVGYGVERVVLMHPTDQTFYDAMSSVVAASLRRVGINLDEQSLDWGTVVQRRTSKEPLDKGGWSLFPYGAPAAEYRDPVFATNLRGNGKDAWFGWPNDEKMEALRNAWIGCHRRCRSQETGRTDPGARVRDGAVRATWPVPASVGVSQQPDRSPERRGARVLERQQVLSDHRAAAQKMAHPRDIYANLSCW
jgi:peptide/nickel transport system substrate-binding protein